MEQSLYLRQSISDSHRTLEFRHRLYCIVALDAEHLKSTLSYLEDRHKTRHATGNLVEDLRVGSHATDLTIDISHRVLQHCSLTLNFVHRRGECLAPVGVLLLLCKVAVGRSHLHEGFGVLTQLALCRGGLGLHRAEGLNEGYLLLVGIGKGGTRPAHLLFHVLQLLGCPAQFLIILRRFDAEPYDCICHIYLNSFAISASKSKSNCSAACCNALWLVSSNQRLPAICPTRLIPLVSRLGVPLLRKRRINAVSFPW